jgi:hypothetical protein
MPKFTFAFSTMDTGRVKTSIAGIMNQWIKDHGKMPNQTLTKRKHDEYTENFLKQLEIAVMAELDDYVSTPESRDAIQAMIHELGVKALKDIEGENPGWGPNGNQTLDNLLTFAGGVLGLILL